MKWSVIWTIFLVSAAFVLGGQPNWLQVSLWVGVTAAVAGIYALIRLPFSSPREVMKNLKKLGIVYALSGLAISSYATVKHHLNRIPFWADPILADVDAFIFGADLWTLIPAFGTGWTHFYHPAWIAGVIFTLGYATLHREYLLSLFFVGWAIVSPALHLLLPAGGPIFFERLGYGDRFADMPSVGKTPLYADYLWEGYVQNQAIVGGGISAMPSMHIYTVAWAVLVFWRTPFFFPVSLWASMMFIFSITTGWHYAVDGIVSILVVALFWLVLRRSAETKLQLSAHEDKPALSAK
ncbi:phosphatase PAP2 family protein [Sphingomicrobium marinum]|uniref:phosphatase PAP2 family protein n=1 Tax=Sphingomicrobium marinum TaxID=1227950 RepID=UPI00223F0198|nr:phosphatase PAP2 family protein [Sphingomicrobium marinum]